MNQAMIKNQFFLINAARNALLALTMVFIQSPAAHANSIGLADQMLMITSSSCPWCEAFEDEVGVGYNNSEEAKYFPIHRHDFFEKMPDSYSDIEPAVMTPTFIFIRDGAELGRIIGYPGSELFWWRLSEFTPK